jgi:hypothetical protein
MKKRIALPILLVLVFLAGNYVRKDVKERRTLASTAYRLDDGRVERISPIAEWSQRPYYSHSIWAHGVGSAQELLDVMNADPELGERYQSCRDSIQFQQLTHDIDVFSTFRSTTRIAWSRKTIHVRAGEWVISCGNGALTLLARCLNQIAWTPMEPTDPVNPSTLETPEFPHTPIVTPESASLPPIIPLPTVPTVGKSPMTTDSGWWCCAIVGGGSPKPPSTPVAMPEPSPLILLLAAFAGFAVVKVLQAVGLFQGR